MSTATTTGIGKRTSTRRLRRVAVRFGIEGPDHLGYTRNVSAGGMLVLTPRPFAPGTCLQVAFQFGPDCVVRWASVRWARRSTPGLESVLPSAMGLRLYDGGAEWTALCGSPSS